MNRSSQGRWSLAGVWITACVSTLGCDTPAPTSDPGALQWYHARVVLDGTDEVPFFIEIPESCDENPATIANGEERISVSCRRLDSSLILDFPVYATQVVADVDDTGNLSGYWAREEPDGAQETFDFDARPVPALDPTQRFTSDEFDLSGGGVQGDVSGTWRVEFDDAGLARGVFEQTPSGVVRGTAEVPSEYGDLRFLAGNLRGTELLLSTFDGQHAIRLTATLAADGTMDGEFVSADDAWDFFVAERSEEFETDDPLERVRVISAEGQLDLEPLRDPRYADKAVIIEVFGTWCPNCNDLAPLLAGLHREHQDDGLEILGVAYELSERDDYNRERLRAFNEKHGLDWEVVSADTPPEVLFSEASVDLSPIEGVPVTVFLNRDRSIHGIYAGFSGPATGAAHERAKATFRRLTREILAGN